MSNEGTLNFGYIKEGNKKTSDLDPGVNDVTTTSSPSGPNPCSTDSQNKDGLPNPVMSIFSADIIAKPFSIAAGSAKIPRSKFNPFRKKSGLLNVLAKQSKV
jgi:hypothetical protein